MVPNRKHELYHTLFSDRTPDEIISHLVTFYWSGQWEWVEQALKEKENEGEPETKPR